MSNDIWTAIDPTEIRDLKIGTKMIWRNPAGEMVEIESMDQFEELDPLIKDTFEDDIIGQWVFVPVTNCPTDLEDFADDIFRPDSGILTWVSEDGDEWTILCENGDILDFSIHDELISHAANQIVDVVPEPEWIYFLVRYSDLHE
jgi:hypothetical protein